MDIFLWIVLGLGVLIVAAVWVWTIITGFHLIMLFPRIVAFLVAGYVFQKYWIIFGLLAIIGAMYDWTMFKAWAEYKNKLKKAE